MFRGKGIYLNAWFVDYVYMWFSRGANPGTGSDAGVNTFARGDGSFRAWSSFRVISYYVLNSRNYLFS